MDFLPPDLHHRMVFSKTSSPVPVGAVTETLWRLLEAMTAWGMPYQLWAAHDGSFDVVAIDREETLAELVAASAIDWLGERPPGAPTHRFGAFNRREDPQFADLYLCFLAEPEPEPESGPAPGEGGESPAAAFYAEVRFGVGSEASPDALQERFADVIAILSPDHAFVETTFQSPRALSEVTAPHVGWATFVAGRLGPLPKIELPSATEAVEGGAIVIATPGAFDDDPERAAIRERVARALLPFLEGRNLELEPLPEAKPAGPRLATPLYLQNPQASLPFAPLQDPQASPPFAPEIQSFAPEIQSPGLSPMFPQPEPEVAIFAAAPASLPSAAPTPRAEVGSIPSFALGAARAGAMVWSMGGAHYVTGIAKVSFLLQSGWLAPTAAEPLIERDQYHRRSALQSLEDHSDLIPYLPKGEVFLRGTAFVAEGQRARARLLVQRAGAQAVLVDKLIEIRGDLDAASGGYVTVPLRYELAVHEATSNPVGRKAGAPGESARILNPHGDDAPIGLGPISPYWPLRTGRVRKQDQAGLRKSPIELPGDFSWDVFSVAPVDQRVRGFFHGTERIYLEGFHAKDRLIDAALPGLSVHGRAYFRDGSTSVIAMVADTLRVDLDRRVVSITFRGYVPAPSPHPGDIVFGAAVVAPGGAAPAWPDQVAFPSAGEAEPVAGAVSQEEAGQTATFFGAAEALKTLPFVPSRAADDDEEETRFPPKK